MFSQEIGYYLKEKTNTFQSYSRQKALRCLQRKFGKKTDYTSIKENYERWRYLFVRNLI